MRQTLRRSGTARCCSAWTIALALVLTAAPGWAASTQTPLQSADDASAVLLRDGVIVDAARGVAYLMNREGGIDALRLTDGAVLWTSREAAKPLAVAGDLLIAQAEGRAPGALPVVALHRDAGREVSRVEIELPAGLQPTIDDRPRSSFRAVAAAKAGQVEVSWRAQKLGSEDYQGYVPAAEEGLAPGSANSLDAKVRVPEIRDGSAVFDPRSGRVTAGELATKARSAGLLDASTLRETAPPPGQAGRAFLSADGRHLLVSERLDGEDPLERYQWSVYTRGGELVGQVKSGRSAAPFVVADSQIVFESRPFRWATAERQIDRPLQIQALDLRTGVESWAQSVRETEFAGPFPP